MFDKIGETIQEKWKDLTSSNGKKDGKFKITGDVHFIIDVNIAGNETHTNSVLTINAFSKGSNKIAIAIKCKWSRKYNNALIPIENIKANTYQLSALDCGSDIVIDIESMEEDCKGKARIEFGPITLNPSIKQTLTNLVQHGGTKFLCEAISGYDVEESQYTGSIVLMPDGIKFSRDVGKREECYKVYLQEDLPHIKIIDKKTVAFEFNDYYSDLDNLKMFQEICQTSKSDNNSGFKKKTRESTINPRFHNLGGKVLLFSRLISQNARDLQILGLRIFQARKGLVMDKLLKSAESLLNNQDNWQQDIYKGITTGELVLKVESYKKDISSLYFRSEELAKERDHFKRMFKNNDIDKKMMSPIKHNTNRNNSQAENNSPGLRGGTEQEFALRQMVDKLEEEIKDLKMDRAGLQHKVERMKKNLREIRVNEIKESNKLNETNTELQIEIDRLKENTNQSISVYDDVQAYKDRNKELITEVVKLRDQLRQKEKENFEKDLKNTTDVRMSMLLEKDYSFLPEEDLGSMRDFGNKWDDQFNSMKPPQNDNKYELANEIKKEYEFKHSCMQSEIEQLRLENEALKHNQPVGSKFDAEEKERLFDDIDNQILKNQCLEKANLALIKEVRVLKGNVEGQNEKIAKRETEIELKDKVYEKTLNESQIRKDMDDFGNENPFNDSINATQLIKENPFNTVIMNQSLNPNTSYVVNDSDIMKFKEGYEKKIQELQNENNKFKKDLLKIKVEAQIAKSNAQSYKVDRSLAHNKINELNDSLVQERLNRTEIMQAPQNIDDAERIAKLRQELGEYKKKYFECLGQIDNLKKSTVTSDPNDKVRIENLRSTNEKLMDEIQRLTNLLKENGIIETTK